MRKMAVEKLKLESRIACEDKMTYEERRQKRRSIDEPLKEDSDSNDGPDEQELLRLLNDDAPHNDQG